MEHRPRAGPPGSALVVCVALLFPLLASASAHAASAEPIKLDYAASPECPRAGGFEREVLARTSAVRFVDHNPSRTFRIRIEHRESGYTGTLDVSSHSAPAAHREIEGEHCDSVALVLAIAAALAIDPDANASPAPLSAPPQRAPRTTPRAAHPPPRPAARTPRHSARTVAPPVPQTIRPRPPRPSIDLGAALSAISGPAPVGLIAVSPFVGYQMRGRSLWQPSIQAEPVIAGTGVIGPDYAEAVFSWYALRATGCPLRFGNSLALRPCAVVEAGVLHARGRAIAIPRRSTRPWLSLGLEARLTWQFLPPFFVQAAARAQVIVTRYNYAFLVPHRVFYRTPLLSPALEGGFGVRFF